MDDGTTIKMNKQMQEFWIRITDGWKCSIKPKKIAAKNKKLND